MNRIITAISLILLISSAVSAYEINNTIYAEISDMTLKAKSALNRDNSLQLKELNYLLRGTTELKSKLSENANGVIKLQMDYNPLSYNNNSKEKIFIKEMYVDLASDLFNCRVGKQYLKWGDPIFFNNVDIINMYRDPLRPESEAEGNPFVDFSIPIQSFAFAEIITLFKDKGENKLYKMPLILKGGINVDNFSAFAFTMMEKDKKPLYGGDINFTGTINQESDFFLYTSAALKNESNIYKINSSGTPEKNNKDSYLSLTGGGRVTKRFPYWKKFDRIDFILEYSFDEENWSKDDYKNFCNLQQKKFDATNLAFYSNYKNSKHYIFSGVTVSNVFFDEMQYDLNLITNLQDMSMFCVNSIKYQYRNSLSLGIKYYLAIGGDETEFGNNISSDQIQFSSELAF